MSKFERLYTVFVENEKIQIAKRMLKNGEPVETIAKYTDLEIGTIEELKEQLELESEETDDANE